MSSIDFPRIDPRTREFLARFALPRDHATAPTMDELHTRGRLAMAAGLFTEAELHLRQAYSMARARGADAVGPIGLDLVRVLTEQGAPLDAVAILHELADSRLPPLERAAWHLLTGHLLRGLCRFDLADRHFRVAMECGEEAHQARFSGYALIERAAVRGLLGETVQAESLYDRGIAILRNTEDEVAATATALSNLAANEIHRVHLDRALRALEAAAELREEGSDLRLASIVDLHTAEAAVLAGDPDLARALSTEADRTAGRAGLGVTRVHALVVRTVLDDEADPLATIDRLAEKGKELEARGLHLDGGMLYSLAGVVAERSRLDPDEHRAKSRRILGSNGAAEEFDVHHHRLFDGLRRPRPLRPASPAGEGSPWRESAGPAAGPIDIAVFAPNGSLGSDFAASASKDETIVPVGDWTRLARLASAVDVVVLLLPALAGPLTRGRVARLRRDHPFLPVVLVTRRDAENARHLAEMDVEEVVWLDEGASAVRTAVRRAASRGLLRWIADRFETVESLDPALRSALAQACRSPVATVSVQALADAAGRHRTTVSRRWRQAVGQAGPRLEDVLAWIALLRAVGDKPPHLGWAHAAEAVGVHEQTLREWARRFTGMSLTELEGTGQRAVFRVFLREIVDPLTA